MASYCSKAKPYGSIRTWHFAHAGAELWRSISCRVVKPNGTVSGSKVAVGDVLIGLASSGPHSNGYSLVRKILEVSGASLDDEFAGGTLGQALLEPTRIYVKPLLELQKTVTVKALSHITGGGITENLPRVLPDGACARIDTDSWSQPEIFNWLQQQGNIASEEMYRTFNCGVGMVVCVSAEESEAALAALKAAGEEPWVVGSIESAAEGGEAVILAGA